MIHFTHCSDLFFLFPKVMIFLRGNLWGTLWFLCLMLPLAQGLRLCVWAASTCWCLCLSPVPCSSWPPGLASHFMAASCRESRPWGKEPSMATLLMSRPYELKEAAHGHFKVVHFTIHMIMSEKELKQKAAVLPAQPGVPVYTILLNVTLWAVKNS